MRPVHLAYLCNRRDWLENRGAAVLRLDAPDPRKRTDLTFFQSLLTLLRVSAPSRGNTDQLCALVMGHLIEQALAADSRLVIVFIDEAQRLRPSDYENLVTLDNRMTQAGFYFFAVFVHQRDITGFTNLVVSSPDYPPHVFGRFMVRRHEFTGLRGIDDVAFVLSRYDEGSEWPAGSGTSHTAHFAADAFRDDGFRLVPYAQLLWDSATKLRSQERLPPEWTWPMKSFEAAVVYLLTVIVRRKLGDRPLELTEADMLEALCHAQLLELEKSRVTYKPQTTKEPK